jgi:N-acyl-D-amino-acid deacylase
MVVFNAATVKDEATFDNPHQYATGISYVVVNGQVVVDQGEHTGARPGRVLRKA